MKNLDKNDSVMRLQRNTQRIAFTLMTFVMMSFVLLAYTSEAYARTKSYFILDTTTGQMIDEVNSNQKLHPASLTKMMTLYLAFEAIQRGKLSLNSNLTVSRHAASMVPSKIGLQPGQKITLAEAIHAAAIKSANDAAVVIAEAISGTESAFARSMTQKAHEMGMRSTTFKNASGLTANGHLSTSRDMAILGMRLFKDYPQHYGLFKREATNYRGHTLLATNRRFLRNYEGADGIKTGYTSAAGFNLVASAQRNNKRVIVSYFGADSTSSRNQRVAELMDIGFKKATAGNPNTVTPSAALVARAPLPVAVPGRSTVQQATAKPIQTASLVTSETSFQPSSKPVVISKPVAVTRTVVPLSKKEQSLFSKSLGTIQQAIVPRAEARNQYNITQEGNWGIQLGAFRDQEQAQNHLHQALIIAQADLNNAYRAIDPHTAGKQTLYRARFTGLSQENAKTACRNLSAEGLNCVAVPPESW
jgi:D-alanyl-D-alanine carboxypeptidase